MQRVATSQSVARWEGLVSVHLRYTAQPGLCHASYYQKYVVTNPWEYRLSYHPAVFLSVLLRNVLHNTPIQHIPGIYRLSIRLWILECNHSTLWQSLWIQPENSHMSACLANDHLSKNFAWSYYAMCYIIRRLSVFPGILALNKAMNTWVQPQWQSFWI